MTPTLLALVDLHLRRGRLSKARDVLGDEAQLCREAFGPSDFYTLGAEACEAHLHHAEGDEGALDELKEVTGRMHEFLGAEHAKTKAAEARLAALL